MKKRLLSLLLALSMVVSVMPVSLYAGEIVDGNDDGILNYVSFGASNVNGYGLAGYLDEGITAEDKATQNVYGYQRMPVNSYPYLIAQSLAGGSEAEEGYTGNLKLMQPFEGVHVDQLAMSSMRMEELRFLLDETYSGDSYTDWRFYDVNGDGENSEGEWFKKAEENIDDLRAVYESAIADADLITLDVGINNFGVYVSHQVGDKYKETLEDLDPDLNAEYQQAKEYVREILAENAPDMLAVMNEQEEMLDSLAYTLVGFCTSFDVVMEKIRALNPDATIVVVSIQNLLTGLSMEMNGEVLPLGELFGELIGAANTYTAELSPYSDEYYYADVSENGRVEFFVDQLLAYDGDPSSLDRNMIDCYNVYDDDLHAEKNIRAMVDSFLASQIQAGLGDYVGVVAQIYGTNEEKALLAAYLADGENDYVTAEGTLQEAVGAGAIDETTAKECLAQMKSVYAEYAIAKPYYTELALELGYDVVTEIFKAGVEEHTIDFGAMTAEGKGTVEDQLLGAIAETVTGAVEKLAVNPNYTFDMSEEYPEGFFETVAGAAGLEVGLVKTIACMGIRTGIGNSFYGHPNVPGHEEIADTILTAIANGTFGDEFYDRETSEKMVAFYNFLKNDTSYNSAAKVKLVEKLLAVIEGTGELDKETKALLEIYAYLSEKAELTADQKLGIILCAYDYILYGGSEIDVINGVIDILGENDLTDAVKVDIIGEVYTILEEAGYLSNYEQLQIVEDIYACLAPYMDDAQRVKAAEAVYGVIVDDKAVDDEEKLYIADFIIELLGESDMTDEQKVEVIGEVYGVLEEAGYLAGYAELQVIEDLYACLDPYMNDEQTAKAAKVVYKAIVDDKAVDDEEKLYIADFIIELLGESDMTDEQKVEVIGEVYGVLEEAGYLDPYKTDLEIVEDLYAYLDANEYITDEQSMEILDYVYNAIQSEEKLDETALVRFVFETLVINSKIESEGKIAVIGKVYATLEEAELVKFDKDTEKAIKTIVQIYDALTGAKLLNDDKAVQIIEEIYAAIKDGEPNNDQIRKLAVAIYNILFDRSIQLFGLADGLDHADKIKIIDLVFEVLEENDYLDTETYPALKTAVESYKTLAEADPEVTFEIFEIVFEGLVAESADPEEAVADVADKVLDKLLNSDVPDDVKGEVVDIIYGAVADGNIGGADTVPGLDNPAVKEIYDYLTDKGYVTAAQKGKLVTLAYNAVKGDAVVADLAMDIYDVLDENTNLLDKINIAAYIINTLAEYDYLGEASDMVEIAYKYSYMFAFEEGHVDTVADALDVAVDALEEAKDYVEAFETVEELEATKVGLIAALEQAQKTIKVLKEELLKGDPETLGQMLENQYKAYQDLEAVYALAAKLGITEELLLEQANYALDLINDLKAAAYEWAKATKIQIFEEIIEQAAAIDSVLGDAVRAYIYESPEEALAIIYAAGKDAVTELINKAIDDIEIPDVDLGVVKAEISKLEDTIADIREQIDTLKDYTGEGVDGLIDELEVQLEIAEEYLEKLNNMVEAVETLINELDGDTDVTIDRVKVIVGDVQKMINEAMELADEIADVLDDLADVYEAVMPQLLEVVDGPVKDAVDTSVEEIAQMIEEIEAAYEQTLEILNTASANIESIAVQAAQDVADRVVEAIEDITDATEIAIDEVTTSVETAIAAIQSEAQKLAQSTDDEIRALAEEILEQAEILEQTLQFSREELKAEHKDLMDIVCTLADTAKNAETISELNALLNDAQDVLDDLKEIAEDVYYIAEADILYNLPLIKESAHAIRDQAVESGLNIADAAVEAYNNSVDAILVAADEIYASVLKAMDAYEVAVTTAVTDIIDTVQVAVADVADEVNNAVAATTDVVNVLVSEVLEGAENIVDAWKNALEDGTNGKYVVTTDGYYVAIGDNTAYAEDSYADKLGQYLGIAYDKATLEDEDMIAEADLITVGYDNNDVTDYMLKQVQAVAMGTYEPSDWSGIVGEDGVEYVEVVKSELEAILVNLDLGDTISDYLMAAVEAYAYAYVNQLIENIATVEAIKDINEDALVILVGQYNPLEGVVLTMGEEEIALGDYIQYLVDVVNLESFAYAMLTGDAIYVDAPAVETKSEEAGTALRMPAEEFVGSLFIGGDAMMAMLYPSDAGQIYIKEQILDSLTIYGMLGDADNDGDVDNVDAMLVLQYYTGLVDETDLNLFVCDVDGNGAVNNVDAMLILQYYVELITVFPVAEK